MSSSCILFRTIFRPAVQLLTSSRLGNFCQVQNGSGSKKKFMPCGEDQFVLFHLCPPTHGLWSHYGTNNWLIQNKYQRRMRKTNIFERDIMNHHWNLTCVLCLSFWSILQVILGWWWRGPISYQVTSQLICNMSGDSSGLGRRTSGGSPFGQTHNSSGGGGISDH